MGSLQVLIIMAKEDASEMYIPVFHIPMTGKTTHLYEYALSSFIRGLGHEIKNITSVVCDFEKAMMHAIKGKYQSLC